VPEHSPPDNQIRRRYARGLQLYRLRRWQQSADALEGLLGEGGAVGCLARAYRGRAHRMMAREAMEQRDYTAATRHLQAAAASEQRPRPAAGSGAGAAGAGPMRHCLEEMERGLEVDRASADPRRRLAQVQWQSGRREEAYMTLTRALRRFPEHPGLLLQMGLYLAAEERFPEARAVLAQARDADCGNAEVLRALAWVAAVEGDLAACVAALQRAVDLGPDDLLLAHQFVVAAAAADRAGLRVRAHLPEPAGGPADARVIELSEYIAAEPDFADALLSCPGGSQDQELLGLLAEAVELAIRKQPRPMTLHWIGSRVCEGLGRLGAAIEHAHRALSLEPGYVQARVQLADLYARTGRGEQAVLEYRRAVADGADWPDVHYRVAELLLRARRAPEARRHLRRALELNEQYAPAARALAALAA